MREHHTTRKTILVSLLAMALVLGAGVLGTSTGVARAAPKSWGTWSQKWVRQAHLARARCDRTLSAYGRPTIRKLERAGRDDQSWGRFCKHAAVRWNATARRLLHRMQHPRGSGAARWWPAAKWVGWPASCEGMWVRVVSRESGGSPTAQNKSSGAGGLMQLLPPPARWWDPLVNIRKGLDKYKAAGGWSPWAATAY